MFSGDGRSDKYRCLSLVDLAPQVAPFVGREAPAAAKRFRILVLLFLLHFAALFLGPRVEVARVETAVVVLACLGSLLGAAGLCVTVPIAGSGSCRRHGRQADQAAGGNATDERIPAKLCTCCCDFGVRDIHGVSSSTMPCKTDKLDSTEPSV
ncbi:hypothetical protein LP420_33930 [Massilia sp. B-10]|nr:hypothetical protein LP420_33930 [Massilia sp. B-10]UUZ53582.1 hypothetical protein LP419_33415 [Massilia sp. H-1]